MKEQNIALIKAVYQAFSRGEIAFIMDSLAPNVEWSFEGPSSIPYTGSWHKREEVMQFFAAIGTKEKDHQLSIAEYYGDGDTVFTTGRYAATSVATRRKKLRRVHRPLLPHRRRQNHPLRRFRRHRCDVRRPHRVTVRAV